MNRYNRTLKLFSMACTWLILVGCETNQPGTSASLPSRTTAQSSKDGGHLIVNRIANFGTDLYLDLSVDGVQTAEVREGQSYDGYLPAGRHVLSAIAVPNQGQSPSQTTVTIKKGETYSYTAVWQGTRLVLVRN
jgi:hypothetical protein